jgi:hypothetical protein
MYFIVVVLSLHMNYNVDIVTGLVLGFYTYEELWSRRQAINERVKDLINKI